MKLADLSELKTRVADLAKESSIGRQVQDVVVEANDDDTGGEFLRVVVRMKGVKRLRPRDVEALVRTIEDAVATMDERFPSVRIAEAA